MTLPGRADRMPNEKDQLIPVEHLIAFALNSVPHEWWKQGKMISETSEPVRAVMEAFRLEGYEVVPKGRGESK